MKTKRKGFTPLENINQKKENEVFSFNKFEMKNKFSHSLTGFTPLEMKRPIRKRTGSLTGFTLIELLLVTTIITLFIGIITVSFKTVSDNSKDEKIRVIMGDLYRLLHVMESDLSFERKYGDLCDGSFIDENHPKYGSQLKSIDNEIAKIAEGGQRPVALCQEEEFKIRAFLRSGSCLEITASPEKIGFIRELSNSECQAW